MSLLIDEVMIMEVRDMTYKRSLLKALNKIVWVQNDLFGRHYLACAKGREEGSGSSAEEGEADTRERRGDERDDRERLRGIDEERIGRDVKDHVTVSETEFSWDGND